MAGDTLINSTLCNHSIFHIYDTIINNEHLHTDIDVFVDKVSGLPKLTTVKGRVLLSTEVINYTTSFQYSNFKFNQHNVHLNMMNIPTGFHPQKNETKLPLLAPGIVAPDWTLYTSEGKRISLSQLKGKVVLMDFFFIGCGTCMESLQPLDRICDKYKDQNFVLVSISNRDSRKAVTEFKQKYHIKNTVCGDGNNVARSYHLSGAPLFYCIDKEGKIANATSGYNDDFESKIIPLISSLLTK
ncbi:peroxiredoxin family protein [Mucilaginibacter sp.]